MTALILPKLGDCKNIYEVTSVLLELGATLLGSGAFARVYALDVNGGTRVIKVTRSPDAGGLATARCAIKTCDVDDLAPRYYGLIEFGGDEFVAELELLTAAPKGERGGHGPSTVHLTDGCYNYPNPSLLQFSPYVQALDHARQEIRGGWDIHSDNVMMRGEQPVITDALYG